MNRCSQLTLTIATLALLNAEALAQRTTPSPTVQSPSETRIIRTRGDSAMLRTMQAWEDAFERKHSGVKFENTLLGSATGMAGITTGAADLTVMGRPVTANEIIGFEWVWRVKPVEVAVARGNLRSEGYSPALAVLVSNKNPLHSISLAQLATVLGCPPDSAHHVTWSGAGASGAWAARPLHAYLYDDQTGTGAWLMQTVQGRKDCWNWTVVHEFSDQEEGKRSASEQIAEALDHDPDGLAITALAKDDSRVKRLAVAGAGGPVPLNAATVSDGSYPFTRNVYFYVRKPQDGSIDPLLSEFLEFVLSSRGQAIVTQVGEFLPLGRRAAETEAAKLH
ncbi:MAG TPA: substrate-binding domain-containing protein [Acidobacteriaceae bacterium]|nr:substrate-binding domain-containing protein [Acidobacteriaceae bacterium]